MTNDKELKMNQLKQEQAKAKQEEEKAKLEELKVNKKKIELEILQIRGQNRTCLITTLVFLVVFSFLFLIGTAAGVLTSISEKAHNNYNWGLLLYGSIILLSIVALISFLCNLLVKTLSSSDEE